ncbi:RNA polymerase sigma factor [Novosphingobium tardum]|uniref:RNA polymerase sigma factor n=1 Tax=Novosphingobium tardum TaxID=1538021 RepID=A0ABV8RPG8_9SPHN
MTEGATGGLKAVYLDHRPALARYLMARGLPRDDAEDVLQDLWIRLDGAAPGPVGEPRAYLYRMAHNLLLDRRRSSQRRQRREEAWSGEGTGIISETDETPSSERVLLSRERLDRMNAALAALPERTRGIFAAFRIEGETQQSIADRLGISKSAVEKQIYRAYRVVTATRALLDAEDEDGTQGANEGATLSQPARHGSMRHDHDS